MKKKYNLREIYEEMELYLLSSMARNLQRHEGEEIKEGFRFEMWQSAKLRDLERFRKENKQIIDQFAPAIEKAVTEKLIETYRKAQRRVQSAVIKLADKFSIKLPKASEPLIDGLKGEELQETLDKVEDAAKKWKEAPTPLDENFFRTNDRKFDALLEATEKDMNIANTSVLRKMDDIYRETIFKSQVFHNNGVMDLNKAVDMATKDFLRQGITSIKYSNGHEMNIASYAEMALRTANHRAYLMGEGKKRQELGISTVIVTPHATACEMCRPWQGKVLIDDVYSGGKPEDGDYPLLSKAIEDGLFHPNCEDILATWFPGISTVPTVPDPEQSETWYRAGQKQRRLEREIREQRRVVAGTTDTENLEKEKRILKEKESKLSEHLKSNTQLRRRPERETSAVGPSNKDIKKHGDKVIRESIDTLRGNLTKDGIEIKDVEGHFKDRIIERGITSEQVLDALQNPLKIGNIKQSKDGRLCKEYVGKFARIHLNPETGKLITVWKTSSKLRSKLGGEQNEN